MKGSPDPATSSGTKGPLGLAAGAMLVAAASVLVSAAPAAAGTTIGQLAPTPSAACPFQTDWLSPTVTSGTSYVVPTLPGTIDERITSWSTNAYSSPGQMLTMKVFRNLGAPDTWMVVGHDGPRHLTESPSLNTFSGINIAVKPGDVLGINSANGAAVPNACKFFVPGETYLFKGGDLADGASGMFGSDTAYRMNVTAVVKPSNTFSFTGAPIRNKKKGTALIGVNSSSAGVFDLSGKSVTASGPGTVKLLVKATGKTKKKLKKTGKAKVTANVTFTPTGGDPSTQSEFVMLKKRR
jgi:hypothetical protein